MIKFAFILISINLISIFMEFTENNEDFNGKIPTEPDQIHESVFNETDMVQEANINSKRTRGHEGDFLKMITEILYANDDVYVHINQRKETRGG